jgi:3',5'-cyclic AMP phosphodiesterase CpdA
VVTGLKVRLFVTACVLLGGFAAGQQSSGVEFIHVSDTHVIDLKGFAAPLAKAREHFANSERRLAALLAGVGRPSTASFVLITGDLIDGFSFAGSGGSTVRGQVDAFRRATAKSPIPLFLTLGNHDIQHYGVAPDGVKVVGDQSVAGAARAAWVQSADCFREGTYYEFTKRAGTTRYVFLMLDNGYSAAGATERPPVGMSHEQLNWLRSRALANRDAVIILAMHIPIGKDATSTAIAGAMSSAPNIALILAGHNHRDQIDDAVGLGASTAVQVRTASLGYGAQNWRRIRLLPDRIEVYTTSTRNAVEKTVLVGPNARRPAA